MHRPPRPAFKSTQAFPVQLRKIFTPEYINQESEKKANEFNLKSLRENGIQGQVYQSYNESENIQCLEISVKQNQTRNQHRDNTFHGKSFKIRNYTSTRIKQNTIPIKTSSRKVTIIKQQREIKKRKLNNEKKEQQEAQIKIVQKISLFNYPETHQLQFLNSKVQYLPILPYNASFDQNSDISPSNHNPSEDYTDWVFVIQQSLITGNLSNENTSLKLKSIYNQLKERYPSLRIVVMIEKESEAQQIARIWIKQKIQVDYLMWCKGKYSERVSSLDLCQIPALSNIQNIVVFSDLLAISNRFFYKSKIYQNKQKSIDLVHKVSYIRLNGIQGLIKFLQNVKIDQRDSELRISDANFKNETQDYMIGNEAINKIGVSKFRQQIKKTRSKSARSFSIKSINREALTSSDSKSLNDKNEEFKRKMIQYVRILQEDSRNNKKKSLQKSGNSHNSGGFFEKGNALKFIEHKPENTQTKTPYQVIYELMRNNGAIFKQIVRFQNESEGTKLPESSNRLMEN